MHKFSVHLERLLVYHASVSCTNVRQAIVLGMQGSKAVKALDQCVDSLDAECKVWNVNSTNENRGKQGNRKRELIQWLSVRAK